MLIVMAIAITMVMITAMIMEKAMVMAMHDDVDEMVMIASSHNRTDEERKWLNNVLV